MLGYYDRTRLDRFRKLCEDNKYFNVGYPEDFDFDFSPLKDFLDYSLNNCGDHEAYCNFVLNSFDFETEVVNYFTKLFKGDPEEIYGYVTHGGTEGNLWGLYIARELYPKGIVYISKDAHYSIAKNIHLLGVDYKVCDSQDNGEIDYDSLEQSLDVGRPVIFCATIGSTARGAIDDVLRAQQIFKKKGVKELYIHADEALAGSILPFVEDPQPHTFADGIDSLTVCGTKGFGTPIPCAVALAKRKYLKGIEVEIDYIKCHDVTVSGSRNGITPLFLWYVINAVSHGGFKKRVQNKLALAEYVVQELKKNGVDAWRNRNSTTVVAPIPSESFIHTHKLAPFGDHIHIITTAHNTRTTLDVLIYELLIDYKLQATKK